jgi:hypothetical protein
MSYGARASSLLSPTGVGLGRSPAAPEGGVCAEGEAGRAPVGFVEHFGSGS